MSINLPFDIINYIILFAITKQKKELLIDIIDYHNSKILILDSYTYNNYFVVTYEDELLNNLFKYTNNEKTNIIDFDEKFYDIWSRLYGLNKNNIKEFINKLGYKNINTQINCFLGILLPEERKEFLTKNIEI